MFLFAEGCIVVVYSSTHVRITIVGVFHASRDFRIGIRIHPSRGRGDMAAAWHPDCLLSAFGKLSCTNFTSWPRLKDTPV